MKQGKKDNSYIRLNIYAELCRYALVPETKYIFLRYCYMMFGIIKSFQ